MDAACDRFAEQELRLQAERFRSLVNATTKIVWVCRANGQLIEPSPTLEAFTGVSLLPLDGPSWLTSVHAEDRAATSRAWVCAVSEQSPFLAECRLRRSDGQNRLMSVRAVPVFEPDGQLREWVATARDITEARETEASLRESEERFRATFEQVAVGIAHVGLDGRFLRVNRRFCEIVGRTPEELHQLTFQAITHPEDLEADLERAELLLTGEIDTYSMEKRYLRKDGSTVWVNLTGSVIRNERRAAQYFIAAVDDISEVKQAEERLRQQNERHRVLSEAAAVLLRLDDLDAMLRAIFAKIGPLLELDKYFHFQVNDAGDALWLASYAGIPEEEARTLKRLEFGQGVCGTVAASGQSMVVPNVLTTHDPRLTRIQRYGVRSYVCNPLFAQGRLLGTLSFARVTRDEFDGDELTFLQTICHYVTLAVERLDMIRQLRAADRRKDEFLATLAHELRNPLAPIRNAVQIVKSNPVSDPQLQWSQDVIERQVGQMARLLDDLLDVSRITQKKLSLRRETVSLSSVLHNALEVSRPFIEGMGHALTIQLPDEPVHLDGDATRLAQVFSNLLNNAAKYSDPNGLIAIAARCEGGEVFVTVADRGIGLAPEHLRQIFEMFSQAAPALERAQGGLGIGLSLVKGLVELHGGRVEARSDGPGHGSQFVVRLPRLTTAPVKVSAVKVQEAKASRPSRKVLVVDDSRDGAMSLSVMLQVMGHEARVAYDGEEALAVGEEFRPEVILLDIGMPKLNGYEACRRFRERPWAKQSLILAQTGWGQQEDRRKSQEAGFDHHLVKPLDAMILAQLMEAHSRTREPASRTDTIQ